MGDIAGVQMCFAVVLKVLNSSLQVVLPIFLNQLLTFLQDTSGQNVNAWDGYKWALLMALVMFLKALTENHYFFFTAAQGWKLRSSLSGAILNKSLRIGTFSKSKGKVVNLMSIDVNKIDTFMPFAANLFDGFFQIVAYLSVLFLFIGPSAFIGILVIIFAIPLNIWIMKNLFTLIKKTNLIPDRRIKLINDAINNILGVKLENSEQMFI